MKNLHDYLLANTLIKEDKIEMDAKKVLEQEKINEELRKWFKQGVKDDDGICNVFRDH